MELILSSLALTLLLLVGSLADLLATRSAPHRAHHGTEFLSDPQPAPIVERAPRIMPEYDRAA